MKTTSNSENKNYGNPHSFKTTAGFFKQIDALMEENLDPADKSVLSQYRDHFDELFPKKLLTRDKLFLIEAGLGKNGIRVNDLQNLVYERRGGPKRMAKDVIQAVRDAQLFSERKPSKQITRHQNNSFLEPELISNRQDMFQAIDEFLEKNAPDLERKRFMATAKMAFPKNIREKEALAYFEGALGETGFVYRNGIEHKELAADQNPEKQIASVEKLNDALGLLSKWSKNPKSTASIKRSRDIFFEEQSPPAKQPVSPNLTQENKEIEKEPEKKPTQSLEDIIQGLSDLAESNAKLIQDAKMRLDDVAASPRMKIIEEAAQQPSSQIVENIAGQALRDNEGAIREVIGGPDTQSFAERVSITLDQATDKIKGLCRSLSMVAGSSMEKASITIGLAFNHGGEWLRNVGNNLIQYGTTKQAERQNGQTLSQENQTKTNMERESTSSPSF